MSIAVYVLMRNPSEGLVSLLSGSESQLQG